MLGLVFTRTVIVLALFARTLIVLALFARTLIVLALFARTLNGLALFARTLIVFRCLMFMSIYNYGLDSDPFVLLFSYLRVF